MPIVETTSYRPPFGFGSGHVQSIYPAIFRRVAKVTTRRERIDTADDDFLDLDWSPRQHKRLAIVSHGLEGSSAQPYIQGMATALQKREWDVLAWNFRGCSGEPNRQLYSYHSGATGDLQTVIDHVDGYDEIALIGFSLGGNITLKHLGDLGSNIDSRVTGAVAFSVPTDLVASAATMSEKSQRFYMKRFMKCLRMKVRQKMESHPEEVEDHGLDTMCTFAEFDEKYTAPMNGFASAEEYWTRCSSKPVLKNIRVPTLLVNAQNDPFLPAACHPHEEAEASEHFFFENPQHGGHVGFVQRGEYWSEQRALEFLEEKR